MPLYTEVVIHITLIFIAWVN